MEKIENIDGGTDMGLKRVQVMPTIRDHDGWGFRETAYWLFSTERFITIEENNKIYRIPWSAICYVREFDVTEVKGQQKIQDTED